MQTHQVGRKVRGAFFRIPAATWLQWQHRIPTWCSTMGLFFPRVILHKMSFFKSPEQLDVSAKKDLVFVHLPVIVRYVESQLDWIAIFIVLPLLALERSLARPGIRNCRQVLHRS
jgi:hypothetical protein